MPYYILSRTYTKPWRAIYHQLTLKPELAYTYSTMKMNELLAGQTEAVRVSQVVLGPKQQSRGLVPVAAL